MHELSLIANLFEIMEEKAAEKNARKITHVVLQVGKLSGVVPELLITAFDMYKKDTIASEGKLEIKEVPLKILCRDCKTEVVKDDFVFICAKCGSSNLKTLSGMELYLEKMELEVD
jgi:hydrogenase nickel incorporation protein HypA/HybF